MGPTVSRGSDGGGGRKGRRNSAKRKPMAEINVTPFVDVMLVLLIIFMVVATVSKQEQSLPVSLPMESKSLQTKADPTDKFETITIKSDGSLSLGSNSDSQRVLRLALDALEQHQ